MKHYLPLNRRSSIFCCRVLVIMISMFFKRVCKRRAKLAIICSNPKNTYDFSDYNPKSKYVFAEYISQASWYGGGAVPTGFPFDGYFREFRVFCVQKQNHNSLSKGEGQSGDASPTMVSIS